MSDVWREVTKEKYEELVGRTLRERGIMEGHTVLICEPPLKFGYYEDEAVVNDLFQPELCRVRIEMDYDRTSMKPVLKYFLNVNHYPERREL